MCIKNGLSTSFWTNRWIDGGELLLDYARPGGPEPNPNLPVAALVQTSGEWDIAMLKQLLTEDGVLQVIGVQPPQELAGEDSATWGPEQDGRFRVRSAYNIAAQADGTTSSTDWRTIWRWQGPARVRHFLWLAARDRLLTNAERERRHLTPSALCSHYKNGPETILHVLRDCHFPRLTWLQVIQPSEHQTFFGLHLQDWLLRYIRQPSLSLLFGIFCWSLWRTRNDRVFAGKVVSAEVFLHRVQAWVNVVQNAMDRDKEIQHPSPPARTEEMISWTPPPPEWVTLNSEGSVNPESSHAAAGGLIRDHIGRCLAAFTMNLGICSVTRAELRGVAEGLQLAWDLGFRRVKVQLDSRCALQILQSPHREDHRHSAVVGRFQALIGRDWEVSTSHVYRESNKCADYLASRGHHVPLGFSYFPFDDPTLGHWLLYDIQGVSEPRLVLNEG
ncbi:unnamed protein product [Linum trigynum]|uniref:RNase H type-1 domain-containing protein n=1 Tax=Linum trigynum TaxID=586398 RepID=A0AAV2F2U7_9ROSI